MAAVMRCSTPRIRTLTFASGKCSIPLTPSMGHVSKPGSAAMPNSGEHACCRSTSANPARRGGESAGGGGSLRADNRPRRVAGVEHASARRGECAVWREERPSPPAARPHRPPMSRDGAAHGAFGGQRTAGTPLAAGWAPTSSPPLGRHRAPPPRPPRGAARGSAAAPASRDPSAPSVPLGPLCAAQVAS